MHAGSGFAVIFFLLFYDVINNIFFFRIYCSPSSMPSRLRLLNLSKFGRVARLLTPGKQRSSCTYAPSIMKPSRIHDELIHMSKLNGLKWNKKKKVNVRVLCKAHAKKYKYFPSIMKKIVEWKCNEMKWPWIKSKVRNLESILKTVLES